MLSKIIKERIAERFGREIHYPKDCHALAEHISQTCKTPISASTLQRLFGFVKGIREPRLYTLDIAARYLGMRNWKHLLSTLDSDQVTEKAIEKLSASQVKKRQRVQIAYEPGKQIEVERIGTGFVVLSSNDKKLQLNDEVDFRVVELHYPLTFTSFTRDGISIGRVQVATVSGVTAIKKG